MGVRETDLGQLPRPGCGTPSPSELPSSAPGFPSSFPLSPHSRDTRVRGVGRGRGPGKPCRLDSWGPRSSTGRRQTAHRPLRWAWGAGA